jgi:hypothetical protein
MDTKFVKTYSGRSGSSAALVSPSAPSAKQRSTRKGGEVWGTTRQITKAGERYGSAGKEFGTEYTTVRSGAKAAKTYAGKPGKYASMAKPTVPNKKGK